jgi:hypothetical protein
MFSCDSIDQMKYFLVVAFALVATSLAKVDQERFKKARAYCETQFKTDEEVAQYTFCLFKKMGFQNEAGEFQKDILRTNFLDVLTETKIDEVLTKCTVKKATPEESALHAITCIENINRPVST